MTDFARIDFYTDDTIIDDPYPYFDWLREQGPITRLPNHKAWAVTGFEEAVSIARDTQHFSMANAVIGAGFELPFPVEGDDIADLVEANREHIPFANQIVTLEGTDHARLRSLLTPLFTPSKLKAQEPGLRAISNRLIDEFVGTGKVELVKGYGGPFATLVIADLLGIPEQDQPFFREIFATATVGDIHSSQEENAVNPLMLMVGKIYEYLADRRANPRGDVLSQLPPRPSPTASCRRWSSW